MADENNARPGGRGRAGTSMLGALGMQMASKYANVVVQLGVTMVLARLLTPGQFGAVAVVTVFLAFFAILSDLGVSVAIVQYRDLTTEDHESLFFFSLLFGLALSAAFALLAWPVAWVYGDPDLVGLCLWSTPAVLFGALNMVPNGVLLRRREFRAISVRLVVATGASGALAVAMALAGAGTYALVAQAVARALVIFLWNWRATGLSLLGRRDFAAPLRRILRFSAYQGGFSVINYFSRNLDKILVGATMGTVPLGAYDKAYKLMQFPINNLTSIFSSVLQPYLAEYADRPREIYDFWLKACRALAVVGFLVAAAFVAFPAEVTWVMYGPQWGDSVPIIATLAVSIAPQMLNSTSGAIFQSVGRTDYLFRSGAVCTGISLAAILAGVATGSLAALGALISAAYYLHFWVTGWYLVRNVFGVPMRRFFRAFAPSALAFAAAAALPSLLAAPLSALPYAASLALRALACAGAYAGVTLATGEWRALGIVNDMRGMRGRER